MTQFVIYGIFSATIKVNLKLVSTIYYKIFIFYQMIALQKPWKMYFISSKNLFSFSRYSKTQSLLVDKVIKNKKGLELVTSHSYKARQVTKQVDKNSFVSYVLSDQVWWCYIKRFLSYSKNYICKFVQANS